MKIANLFYSSFIKCLEKKVLKLRKAYCNNPEIEDTLNYYENLLIESYFLLSKMIDNN